MDGENNGKPYFLMDDLAGKSTIFGNIHIISSHPGCRFLYSKSFPVAQHDDPQVGTDELCAG